MSNTKARLLAALGALGLSAGIATDAAAVPATETPSYGSFAEVAAYMSAVWSGDLKAKLDFVRSYPKSQVAQTVVREIATELNRMEPGERQAAMAEIEAVGGIPSEALGAAAEGMGSVGGLGGRSMASALESIATSSTSRGPSIY